MPHLNYLRGLREEKRISSDVFYKIAGGNALNILPLYTTDSKAEGEEA
jgi:hypothetical protein